MIQIRPKKTQHLVRAKRKEDGDWYKWKLRVVFLNATVKDSSAGSQSCQLSAVVETLDEAVRLSRRIECKW
jgi:hypothetical protein